MEIGVGKISFEVIYLFAKSFALFKKIIIFENTPFPLSKISIMKKTNYFKSTFLPLSVGLSTGLFVYGLLTTEFTGNSVLTTLLKSITVGVVTGLVLGLLNIYFKLSLSKKKE